jgi:prephenate dehydrogenase
MTNFVALLGASPYFIDPVEHDGLMAGIQHLPVLTATALLRTVAASSSWQELAKLAGHDFYHATTPADREPETVREVFSAQPADMVRWIDALVSTLQEWRGMVEKGAGDEMESAQAAAVQARADWLSGRAFQPIQPVDMSSVRLNLARMFIGGLADRGPKRK